MAKKLFININFVFRFPKLINFNKKSLKCNRILKNKLEIIKNQLSFCFSLTFRMMSF